MAVTQNERHGCCCSVTKSYPTLYDSMDCIARQASLWLTISWSLPKFTSKDVVGSMLIYSKCTDCSNPRACHVN